ncbi:hypothetical protein H4Q26_013374 [Puccinia striiformis f. sp. tritici PST-130]|nr:hypothetical protein H4Q26_013374 [Puccinia striiformis f. sp. tritici PST-130]
MGSNVQLAEEVNTLEEKRQLAVFEIYSPGDDEGPSIISGHECQDPQANVFGHCRLKIRGAHYPGLIPASVAEVALGRPATLGEQTVTGTLVSGLTSSDVALLDAFEGEEYEVQTALVTSSIATALLWKPSCISTRLR